MSLFADFEPPKLHRQTWAERHRFEILVFFGTIVVLALFLIAFLFAEPTVAGVV